MEQARLDHLIASGTNGPKKLSNEYVSELLRLLNRLGRMFRRELDEEEAVLYLESLADLSLESLEIACDTALKRSKRFPTAAELREYAAPKSDPLSGQSGSRRYCEACEPDGWVLEKYFANGREYRRVRRCSCHAVQIAIALTIFMLLFPVATLW